MTARPPANRALLEAAWAIVERTIVAAPERPDSSTVDLTDEREVLAHAYLLTLDDLAGHYAHAMLPAAERESQCAWCTDAAGGTAEACEAAVRRPWAEAREHVSVCEHNPLVKEVARLRLCAREAINLLDEREDTPHGGNHGANDAHWARVEAIRAELDKASP